MSTELSFENLNLNENRNVILVQYQNGSLKSAHFFACLVLSFFSTTMDERVSSVMRVMHAIEEMDHSELTRGNVKAASRAVDSLQNEANRTNGK